MCMEDIRIGRETVSQMKVVAVDVAAAIAVGSSNARVALVLGASNGGRVTYSTQKNPVIDGGLTFVVGSEPFTLDIKVHGDIVRQQWYVIAAAAGSVAVIETFLAREANG